jgi:hypothetical protein
MEVEELNLIRALSEDLAALKVKVEGMESMLETLVELYTDAFYEVRGDYLEKLDRIRREGEFEAFRDITELKQSERAILEERMSDAFFIKLQERRYL